MAGMTLCYTGKRNGDYLELRGLRAEGWIQNGQAYYRGTIEGLEQADSVLLAELIQNNIVTPD